MEDILIRVLQFMLSISLLVLLHEGGHFFFSKLFGVRVEKFYLFFDPWFHIFEFKPKHSDTTYGLGWLPLGGYCKIAGMIDESFDTEQMKKPAEQWEFRSKPAWQRLLIMIGGVTVNFILALFIYSMLMFTWGDTYIMPKNYTQGMQFNSYAKSLGFQDHDILVGSDVHGEFKEFGGDMYRDISQAKRVDVIRKGKKISIQLPGDLNMLDMIKAKPSFMYPYLPNVVDSIEKGSPAQKIGIQSGDKILAINGQKVVTGSDFTRIVRGKSDDLNKGMSHKDSTDILTVPIVILHKNATKSDTTKVTLVKDAETDNIKIGLSFVNVMKDYKQTHIEYSFLASFPAGIKYGWDVLKGYIGDMKYVASKDGVKSLGGFGAIGSMFPTTWDWYLFWKMTAFLSIILAFMNILPIPALDGGHVMFLIYEMITRRKPSEDFLVKAEYVGFTILILLLIVANLNDVLRFLGFM